jgi:FtsH-binding integral membrane protein
LYGDAWTVAQAPAEARSEFIHKTYQHLGLAILAFMAVEYALFQIPGIDQFVRMMIGGRAWLVVLLAYMGVSWAAQRWAMSETGPELQYVGLGLFVVAEAVIFLPLLWIAIYMVGPNVVPTAALITGVTFAGLTATVMISKKDFSFMGGTLRALSFAALGVIAASILFGFSLGVFFAFAMAAFAAGSIVYETSNVLHRYRPDQHVAASLALFASVALLFWYVLRILMSLNRR